MNDGMSTICGIPPTLIGALCRGKYKRAAQDEEAAAKLEDVPEKAGCCGGCSSSGALLIPGLILFSDLLASLASGVRCAPHSQNVIPALR